MAVVLAGRAGADRVFSGLSTRNGDSVGLWVPLLSDSDGLGGVSWGRSVGGSRNGDGDGHRRRAVVRDGGNGSVHRNNGSVHWRLDRRLWLWGVGRVNWNDRSRSGTGLAAATVDGGCESRGVVRGSQVSRVDGRVAGLTNRCGAWHPGVSSLRNGGGDILRRSRLGWCGCWSNRSGGVVAALLAGSHSYRAGSVGSDDLSSRGLCDGAHSGCGVSGVLSSGRWGRHSGVPCTVRLTARGSRCRIDGRARRSRRGVSFRARGCRCRVDRGARRGGCGITLGA